MLNDHRKQIDREEERHYEEQITKLYFHTFCIYLHLYLCSLTNKQRDMIFVEKMLIDQKNFHKNKNQNFS